MSTPTDDLMHDDLGRLVVVHRYWVTVAPEVALLELSPVEARLLGEALIAAAAAVEEE